MSLNRCEIIGYLGRDPEMRYTSTGSAMTTFSVGVSNVWTKDGDRHEKTEWFQVVCWNQLAEVMGANLTKGRQVFVEGRMETRSWDQDGQKRYRTELVARSVQFLGPSPNGQHAGNYREGDEDMDPEDLPFDDRARRDI